MGERSLAAAVAQLQRRLDRIEKGQRIAHGASIENAALEVRDGSGSLRAVVGQQADGTSGVNVVNGPVPPTPSLPVVSPALGALVVAWDGGFSDSLVAPLDWMRVEVHVGPDASFSPSQGTLRDTVETAQGGTVTVPLPYTEWWVKLRSRSSAGVAGAATSGVSGTPKKTEAADIAAGAITADSIAVDALTGKTITGGQITGTTIDGAVVTGGLVRTGSSGERIALTPTPPAPLAQRPTVVLYTGRGDELVPGVINSGSNTTPGGDQPIMALSSPTIAQDAGGNYTKAIASLSAPKAGAFGGRILLQSNAPGPSSELGYTYLDGRSASTSSGISELFLEAKDGSANPQLSQIYMTGAGVQFNGATIAANGIFYQGNIASGQVTITPVPNTPTPISITGLNVKGTTFLGFATPVTTVPGTFVTGVGVSGVTSTGITIWVTRTNNTPTDINWMIRGI